jgi:hypothetical protein
MSKISNLLNHGLHLLGLFIVAVAFMVAFPTIAFILITALILVIGKKYLIEPKKSSYHEDQSF